MRDKLTKEGKLWLVLLTLGPALMAFLKSCSVSWATLGNYESIMWLGGGIFLFIETFYENSKELREYEPLAVLEMATALSWLIIGIAFFQDYTPIITLIDGYHAMFLTLGIIFSVMEVYTDL